MVQISATVGRKGGMAGKIAAASARIGNRLEKGLMAAAEELLYQSQEIVPKDTEALHDTAIIRSEGSGLMVMSAGYGLVITVGYGQPGVTIKGFSQREQRMVDRTPYEYAVFVHEGAWYPPIPPGQMDFLRGSCHSQFFEIRNAFWRAFG